MSHNKYSIFFSLILLVVCLLLSCKTTTLPSVDEELYFYVGTNTGDPQEGIYVFSMNMKNGTSKQVNKYANILNPGYVTVSQDGNKLYAIHNIEGEKESAVTGFRLDKSNGDLILINSKLSGGYGGCHISTDSDGDVLVAHYSSGSVCLLPIDQDGKLSSLPNSQQHEGSSIDKERQAAPHAHFIQEGIGGIIYAVDLGIDKVMLYKKVNNQLMQNNPSSIDLHPGAGPRHLDFHPDNKFLYVLNELEGSVTCITFQNESNSYTALQTISTLPGGFKGYNKSADIHIHPTGKFLYASNRGDHNSIAVYKINQSSGFLSLVDIETESIAWPRNFTISPDGNYLLCANRDSDSITIYKIDQKNGALEFTGQKVYAPKPICVKF